MMDEIKLLIGDSLTGQCQGVYFYGSQINIEDKNKDIDLVIIYQHTDNKIEIAQRLNGIQRKINQLIHPIFLSNDEIVRNPNFKKIILNAHKIL